jgi:hypothetical protein
MDKREVNVLAKRGVDEKKNLYQGTWLFVAKGW